MNARALSPIAVRDMLIKAVAAIAARHRLRRKKECHNFTFSGQGRMEI
jgi:hypothetical protein